MPRPSPAPPGRARAHRPAARVRAVGGITLVEMMIALVIAGVLFSAAVMGVGALTGAAAKSAAGELAGTVRTLYDTANLAGKTCRLVFDLGKARDEEARVTYWAECAKGNVTTDRDRERALEKANEARDNGPREKRSSGNALSDLMDAEATRVEAAAAFSSFSSESMGRKTLPAGVRATVWTRHQREPTDSGLAYLHFFPQGFTEFAHVKLRQGDNVWTLVVSPLTGKVTVEPRDLEVPRT
ncbi:MAG: hypothetical protein RL653_2440 [Pseudomonadota bacterium]